jgi:hypothetical protein
MAGGYRPAERRRIEAGLWAGGGAGGEGLLGAVCNKDSVTLSLPRKKSDGLCL